MTVWIGGKGVGVAAPAVPSAPDEAFAQQNGYWTARDSVLGIGVLGLYTGMSASDASSSKGEDAGGIFLRQNSAGTGSGVAGVAPPAGLPLHRREYNSIYHWKFGLEQTNDIRMFYGMADQDFATMTGSDDPPGNYVGVQFSDPRTDTNFQFITKDGVTRPIQDTGIAKSLLPFAIRVTFDDSVPNALLELLDNAGAVLKSHTFTANLPGATVGLVSVGGIRDAAVGVHSVRSYRGAGINPV